MSDMLPRWVTRSIQREEAQQRERVAQLAATLRRAELLRKDSGEAVTVRYADDQPRHPWQAGLTLEILVTLPRLNSSALRKIADECERMISERTEDGVFD